MALSIDFNATNVRFASGVELYVSGSINLEKGSIALVVGDNGCGKTTILSLIQSVVENEASGHLLSLDWDSIEYSGGLQKVARVFQEPRENFICRSSADEIVLPLLNPTLSAEDALVRLETIVDAADIHRAEIFEKRIDELSSGEQQKLAIAAALVSQPSVMLWDEALARVDSPSAQRIGELMKGAQGDTILIASTHRPARYAAQLGREIGAVLTLRREENQIYIVQTNDATEIAQCVNPSDRTINFAERPLWMAYAGEIPIDAALRLFSNGFRVFGGPDEALLEIDDLEVRQNKRRIAFCRQMSLRRGVNFVVGRNGSGKTTLLETLSGKVPLNPPLRPWLAPSSRYAVLELRLPGYGPLRSMRNRGLSAFLPAEPFRWLTDERATSEIERFHDGTERSRRLDILRKIGVDPETNPEFLSYGQRKVLSLLSLPDKLEIVCLDEPFADLGLAYIELVEQFIAQQCSSNSWISVALSHSSDVEVAA